MKIRPILFVFVILAAVLFASGCNDQKKPIDVNDDPITATGETSLQDDSLQIADGVYIEEIFSFSGEYVEDGSNDLCENIAAVKLVNDSDVHYQYLEFTVSTETAEYSFSASTLFAGARMTVLDQKRTVFSDEHIISVNSNTVAPFVQQPTVHLETFEISYLDGIINVKNLTDQDHNDVYVYYKNIDENGYFGGITYRSAFGTVAANAIAQNSAANIHKDSSRVVFVTFSE